MKFQTMSVTISSKTHDELRLEIQPSGGPVLCEDPLNATLVASTPLPNSSEYRGGQWVVF